MPTFENPATTHDHPSSDHVPVLRVRTVRIDEHVDLLRHIPAHVSAAWLRHGQGMVGIGSAWQGLSHGGGRFADASRRFAALAQRARVDDEVQVRGSGLISFGSFSYADSSPRPSRLLVPQAVLGTDAGEAFLTTITDVSRGGVEEPSPHWRDLFPTTPRGVPAALEIHPDHEAEEYQDLVARAVSLIRAQHAQKVVLSESSTVELSSPTVPAVLLRRLAEAYPTTSVYHLADVIGASPEMLADTEDGRVFSRVLAGSRPVAEGAELAEQDRRAFRADRKERSEHAYAVDSVTGPLQEVASEVTGSAEPFVLRLPGLEHLASDVTGVLREGVSSLDVAGLLHPSAAVSGTPRREADEIIARLEPRDRGGYAAPVGWIDAHGDGQWAIALRMAHLEGPRRVRVQSGGGLVLGSDPVVEHAEALAKARPMLNALRG